MSERRPRQYAAAILAEPDADTRDAMLGAVPAHLRAWVAHYLDDHDRRRACRDRNTPRPATPPR